MKKIIFLFYGIIFLAQALPAMAAPTIGGLLNDAIDKLLRPIPAILIGIAVVMFIYGVIILMFSEGGEKKEEGKQYMVWGIVGIFVIISIWGLVGILAQIFNLNNQTPTIMINDPNP
jgi:uncharacterized membrane protein